MPGPRPSVLKLFDPLNGPETPRRLASQTLDDSADKENTPKAAGEVTMFFRKTFKSKASQRSDSRSQFHLGGALVDIQDAISSGTFGRLDGVAEEYEEEEEDDKIDERRRISVEKTIPQDLQGGCLEFKDGPLTGLSENVASEEELDETISIPLLAEDIESESTPTSADSVAHNFSSIEAISPSIPKKDIKDTIVSSTPMITLTSEEDSQSLLSPSVSLSTTTAYLQPSPLCSMLGTTPSPLTPSEPSLSPLQVSQLISSIGSVGTVNMNKVMKSQGRKYDVSFDILNDDMSFLSGMGDDSQDSHLFPFQAQKEFEEQDDCTSSVEELKLQHLKQMSAIEYEKKLLEMKTEEAEPSVNDKCNFHTQSYSLQPAHYSSVPEIRPLVFKAKQQITVLSAKQSSACYCSLNTSIVM